MKILLVHNIYQQSGGEDAVLELEKEMLLDQGNDVFEYTVDNHSITGIKDKLATALSVNYSYSAKKKLIKALLEVEPDIVHVHNFFPLLTPSIYDACIEHKVPVVQTLHNYRMMCPGALLMRDGHVCEDCIEGSAYQAVIHACYRESRAASFVLARMVQYHRRHRTWQNKVNRFIALTDFAKNKFIQAGFPENKIIVKPNFTITDECNVKQSKSDMCRALFVGRISREKGIGTLLKAWKNISTHLSIIGDGPLLNEVRMSDIDSVSALGLTSSNEVHLKMLQASFLVMPSEWYEGFPMVLVEAYSCGLPVIASRLGGMAEIVEDGVTGLHFEAGNAEDLAEKVRWMACHPEECKKMGGNARKIYEEKYTAEINYKMLMQIYQDAIQDNG